MNKSAKQHKNGKMSGESDYQSGNIHRYSINISPASASNQPVSPMNYKQVADLVNNLDKKSSNVSNMDVIISNASRLNNYMQEDNSHGT